MTKFRECGPPPESFFSYRQLWLAIKHYQIGDMLVPDPWMKVGLPKSHSVHGADKKSQVEV